MPRREGIAAGSRNEKLDIDLLKGTGTLYDGFDDLVVENGHQCQGNDSADTDPSCLFKAEQDHAHHDPNDTAIARSGDGFHDRRDPITDDMVLDPIKYGKIKIDHWLKYSPLISLSIILVKIE